MSNKADQWNAQFAVKDGPRKSEKKKPSARAACSGSSCGRYGTQFTGCVGSAEEKDDCERRGGDRTQKEVV